MYLGKSVIIFTAAILVMSNVSAATPERLVTYRIHEVPDDPQSDVVFVVTLAVREAARDGDFISWEITEARFEQPGDPSAVWVKESPMVWSPDGRWWLRHADPDNPTSAEFTKPPRLIGAAIRQEAAGEDLNFVIEGVPHAPGWGTSSSSPGGALDYKFTLVGAGILIEEGEDDPVEIVPFREPPGPT